MLILISIDDLNKSSDDILKASRSNEHLNAIKIYKGEFAPGEGGTNEGVEVSSSGFKEGEKGLLAIIIDDIGNNYELSMKILEMDYPLTVAILPDTHYAKKLMEEAKKRGKEVILHQPMQVVNSSRYNSAGMLHVNMTKTQIRSILEENLAIVSDAVGVNNHMGSLFTQDDEKMRYFLEVIQEKGLFYIDSLTHPKSKGYILAKSMGIKTLKRDIFLDNIQSKEYIKENLYRSVNLSKTKGYAIAIAHPYEETIYVLEEELEKILKIVDLVNVSTIIRNYYQNN